MAAILSVPYTIEADEGIREAFPAGEPQAVVKFKCDQVDAYKLVADLIGTSVKSGNSIVRTFPYAYPPSPNLYCRTIESIEYIGKPKILTKFGPSWLTKSKAVVTARFEVPKFFPDNSDPSGKPYTTTTIGAGGSFLTLPRTAYLFPSGRSTDTPIGILLPEMEISVQRHMMPFIPISEIASVLGKVNSVAATFGDYVFPVGTVVFSGADASIQTDTLGNVIYEVGYKFMYRFRPWNQYLSPSRTEGWATVTDGNGNPVYDSADIFGTLP